MKKLILILAVALVSFANVQAQKIGHIDVTTLVQSMPDMKKAETTLQTETEAKRNEITKLETALEAKLKSLQERFAALTEAQQKAQGAAMQTEYTGLQEEAKKIEELRAQSAQAIQKRQQELLSPIEERALAAIDKVAANKGLEYVIDSSSGVLLVRRGTDIMVDVKKELGIF